MADLVVPPLGESISEAVVAKWLKQIGDAVAIDEPIAELETDKITVQLPSPVAGALTEQRSAVGATVKVGDVIGAVDPSKAGAVGKPAAAAPAQPASSAPAPASGSAASSSAGSAAASAAPVSASTSARWPSPSSSSSSSSSSSRSPSPSPSPSPSASPSPQAGNGLDKDSLLRLTPSQRATAREVGALPSQPTATAAPTGPSADDRLARVDPRDEVVPMSSLRKRVAERLVQAQHEAASLTTFNEVDMSAVMELRGKYKDSFEKTHGVKLGFMSFFVKACVAAARLFPGVNAEIIGGSIVYKKHYDFGIAVSTQKGLVVPVLRDCETRSFAGIEKGIGELADKARTGKLTLPDLQDGTFTLTNGGIYGSMMSTPLLNYPQTGILGMHNIVKRAVVVGDAVVVRPMMYVALSYDHRVVDGKEAVSFLVAVKERLEAPDRMLVEV